MTGNCCVYKCLRRSVYEKHLMRFRRKKPKMVQILSIIILVISFHVPFKALLLACSRTQSHYLLGIFLCWKPYLNNLSNKQLLDEVFSSLRLRLITFTETSIIPDITKTESNICFIIHCFKEYKDKCIMLKKRFDHPCHITRELDIALKNHALRAQPTDDSLIS